MQRNAGLVGKIYVYFYIRSDVCCSSFREY